MHTARPASFWEKPLRLVNGTGRSLLQVSLPTVAMSLMTRDFLYAQHAALVTLLALRCHQLETGELPASLAELVPRYLKAVPLDPHDGQQLRYSRDRRIVYSVGEDLKDAGGAADTDSERASENRDEPRFEIEL
jgi:hypothetical protein